MSRTPEQRQHIRDVADAIEAEHRRFEMSDYVALDPDCGTTTCIAAWSCHVRNVVWDMDELRRDGDACRTSTGQLISHDAAKAMGLDAIERCQLLEGQGVDSAEAMPEHLRAKGMSDALRQIADGSEVVDALDDVVERYV